MASDEVVAAQDESSEGGGVADEAMALEIAGSWLAALTDGSREVVALLDEDGSAQYLSVSGAVQAMLGYDALEIMAMTPSEMVHPLDLERVMDAFRTVASHPGGRLTIEFRARHRHGHYVRLESTAVNRLHNAHVAAIVVHTREVPTAELPLARPENGPALPEVSDEVEFVQIVAEAIERAERGERPFAVVILELERGDSLVEAYGRDTADEVMAELGRRVALFLRPEDRLCRLNREQYAVALDGVGERAVATRIAERIQRTVGHRFTVKGQDILSGSIVGVATSERRYQRAVDVLRDASQAAAKARADAKGSRRAAYGSRRGGDRSRHMQTVAELHNALRHGELAVHYMPVVALATRTLGGFEALLRWEHPQRGLLLPDAFLPIAEESGLIVPIGRWLLDHVCQQMARWRGFTIGAPLVVNVNLAAKQLADGDFNEQLGEVLARTGIDASQLLLEVSERTLVEEREAVREGLLRASKRGVRIGIDNFGAGASSLAALCELRYDRLSIDRTLVAAMTGSAAAGDEQAPRPREMVRAIVSMAHELSIEVQAEGVEMPGQVTALSKLWCEYAQGHLFGPPMSADSASELLASQPRWWD